MATQILRPTLDYVIGSWVASDSAPTHWSVLNETAIQPAATNDFNFFISTSTNGSVGEYGFQNVKLGDGAIVTQVVAWVRHREDVSDQRLSASIVSQGQVLATTQYPFSNFNRVWNSTIYTGNLTQAQVDDLRIRVTRDQGTGGSLRVQDCYLEVTASAFAPVNEVYVDGILGSDITGNGSASAPFATLNTSMVHVVEPCLVYIAGKATPYTLFAQNLPVTGPNKTNLGPYAVRQQGTGKTDIRIFGAPVTILPWPGTGRVEIAGYDLTANQHITWLNINFTGVARLFAHSRNINHIGCSFRPSTAQNQAVRIENPNVDISFEDCNFKDLLYTDNTDDGYAVVITPPNAFIPDNIRTRFKRCRFENIPNDGIQGNTTRELIVEDCLFDNFHQQGSRHSDCIQLFGANHHPTFERNTFTRYFFALMLQNVLTRLVLRNNVIGAEQYTEIAEPFAGSYAIQLGGESPIIVNNVFYPSDELSPSMYAGILFGASRAITFVNNIARFTSGLNNPSWFEHRNYNIQIPGGGYDAFVNDPNSIQTAPTFVDRTANDLRLTSGSVGLDSGLAFPLMPLVDRGGRVRPTGVAPDIGAYERQVGDP